MFSLSQTTRPVFCCSWAKVAAQYPRHCISLRFEASRIFFFFFYLISETVWSLTEHNVNNSIHIKGRLLFLSTVTKHMDVTSLLFNWPADETEAPEVCFLGKFRMRSLSDLHLKDAKKIIVAKLQKYQAIRGREEGRKERWRGIGDRCRSREQRQIYK